MTGFANSVLRIAAVLGTLSLIACAAVPLPPGSGTGQWLGSFDGRDGALTVITSGDNILTVQRAFVYDNGEGKHPDGSGSDRAWYGWTHGPYGNIRIEVWGPGRNRILRTTDLHGPHPTVLGKHEWIDNEGQEFTRYGIYDWDAHTFDSVWIRIYESDPGPFRDNDELLTGYVTREESILGITLASACITRLDLQTCDLPD